MLIIPGMNNVHVQANVSLKFGRPGIDARQEASALQMVGYTVSLGAFSAYTYFKVNKM